MLNSTNQTTLLGSVLMLHWDKGITTYMSLEKRTLIDKIYFRSFVTDYARMLEEDKTCERLSQLISSAHKPQLIRRVSGCSHIT